MADFKTFTPTPVDSIPGIVNGVRETFLTHKTRDIEYRLVQLRKLYWSFVDHEKEIYEVLKKDLGRSTHESFVIEFNWLAQEMLMAIADLKKWAKDEKDPDTALQFKIFTPRIRKDPLGTILIIGAFNFPWQLAFGPLIGAIAAGNTVVLKPSEGAPASAALMGKVFREALDSSAYAIVQGAIPETSALLDQKWDKICYTGSATVGTIIAKKAAETLTPVLLELGGRNPAFVTKNADVSLAAKRLMWGKFMNSGQVCISHNYTLVDREVLPFFASELKRHYDNFFPNGAKASPDYSRIAGTKHFRKLKSMIDETKGRILFGGSMDEDDLFIEPTVIQVDSTDDILISEESFGPILPLLPVNDLDEAIAIANKVDPTPLASAAFGSIAEGQKVLSQTRSGGSSVNDSFFHASIPTMPFGGVGTSGQGGYRGRHSFEAFSHRRPITVTPAWVEALVGLKYPPFTAAKTKQAASMSRRKPNFDRSGKVIKRGILQLLLGLGAGGAVGGLLRWALVAIAAVAVKRYYLEA